MDDSKRQKYLKEVWKNRFPSISSSSQEIGQNVRAFGRIAEMSPLGFSLFSNGRINSFKWDPKAELEEGFTFEEVLKPGDLVQLETDQTSVQSVKLLVPSNSESPFTHLKFDAARASQWQNFLKAVRDFFSERGFTELLTPTLVPSPGLEPCLDSFQTEFYFGGKKTRYFLPTSPEFHLKKTLSLGYERCFEIKTCFRNSELSLHHQPEFQMIEWYRAYENIHVLMSDIKELLDYLPKKVPGTFLGEEIRVVKMETLWKEELGFELTPETSLEDLLILAKRLEIETTETDFDDLFAHIFLLKIESRLAEKDAPVILWHYPPSQAALARLTEDGWADRFELYWRGLEIANAFHELNDPKEQRTRFLQDQQKKKELGKTVVPIDEEFMKALEWGMPPSAGIALGLERLFMALFKIKSLGDVRLFPIKP